MPQKRVGGTAQRPPLESNVLGSGRSDLGDDSGDRVTQRGRDSTTSTSTERKNDCADDTSRDDHVFERHHAVRVRAQTLQGFGGLDIIFQHRGKSFYKMNCCIHRNVRWPCCQRGNLYNLARKLSPANPFLTLSVSI